MPLGPFEYMVVFLLHEFERARRRQARSTRRTGHLAVLFVPARRTFLARVISISWSRTFPRTNRAVLGRRTRQVRHRTRLSRHVITRRHMHSLELDLEPTTVLARLLDARGRTTVPDPAFVL